MNAVNQTSDTQRRDRPRAVIVGAGFGGVAAARRLADCDIDVTIIDRQNHHLFQPLLYQVSTGQLAGSEVGEPVRRIFRGVKNVDVVQDEVRGIDADGRAVRGSSGDYPYDHLVLATGSVYNYFGNEEFCARSLSLKTMRSALDIREHIFTKLEEAERCRDPEARRRLLTFAIIGGGPTGVEMAGALSDLMAGGIRDDFRRAKLDDVKILLLQANESVLMGFPEHLQRYAIAALRRKGVDVRLGHLAQQIEPDAVVANDERFEAGTIIWAAGVKPRPAAEWLEAETNGDGRIRVEADMTVPGRDSIFAVGDIAYVEDAEGEPLPALAAVAKQEGYYAADCIRADAVGEPRPKPFRYRDYGTLATVGRFHAVADLNWMTLKGLPGWIVWNAAHVWFLLGVRNRFFVMLRWALTLTTRSHTSRIIVTETRAEIAEKRRAATCPD